MLVFKIWPKPPNLLDKLYSQDETTLKNFELDFFKLTPKKQYDLISKSLVDDETQLVYGYIGDEKNLTIVKKILNHFKPDDRFKMLMQPTCSEINNKKKYVVTVFDMLMQAQGVDHVFICTEALCKDFSIEQKLTILNRLYTTPYADIAKAEIVSMLLKDIPSEKQLELLKQKNNNLLRKLTNRNIDITKAFLSGLTDEQLKPIFSYQYQFTKEQCTWFRMDASFIEKGGFTILEFAISQKNTAFIDLLIERGAKADPMFNSRPTTAGIHFSTPSSDSLTPENNTGSDQSEIFSEKKGPAN